MRIKPLSSREVIEGAVWRAIEKIPCGASMTDAHELVMKTLDTVIDWEDTPRGEVLFVNADEREGSVPT